MKAVHSLLAITLAGALSGALLVTMEPGPAVAKSRHHFPGEGSHTLKSSEGVQKSAGASGPGAVNNAITGTKINPNTSDMTSRNASVHAPDGSMKKGESLSGKIGPQNSGSSDLGKNQVSDRADGGHHEHDAVHPGTNGDAEVIKRDSVVADGPGHNTKKSADTTKKITTIFRLHMSKDERHLPGPGTIERNAIGFAIYNGSAKAGLDSKLSAKGDVAPATSAPSPTATKAIANPVTPAIGHQKNAVDNPAKNGSLINGTLVGRPGSNLASVGGSTKNIVGTLSGNSFKPKHP